MNICRCKHHQRYHFLVASKEYGRCFIVDCGCPEWRRLETAESLTMHGIEEPK